MFDDAPLVPPETPENQVAPLPPVENEQPEDAFDEGLSIPEAWEQVILHPSEESFARIIKMPQATMGNALLWVALAGLFSGFMYAFLFPMILKGTAMPPGAPMSMPFDADSWVIGLCMIPLMPVVGILGLLINGGLIHWSARLLHGEGEFDKFIFAVSMIVVPLTFLSGIAALISMAPVLGVFSSIISYIIGIYNTVLEIFAVKVAYGFDSWGKAIGAVFLPLVLIVFLVCCCIALVVALIAAADSASALMGALI